MPHTAGPWTIDLVGKLQCPQIVAGIRRITDLVSASEEDYSNASLISASPDLLAACEQALLALRANDGYKGEGADACKSLRAAIAKAKG